MAIAFFAAQCDEKKVPLHTPRVIRDAFHDAIKRPDDLAGGNRGGENFEQHEVEKDGSRALNGVRHWLRLLVPRLAISPLPHAAQDRDNAPPSPQCAKRWDPRRARRSSTPASSCARRPAQRVRRTPDVRTANNPRTKQHTSP